MLAQHTANSSRSLRRQFVNATNAMTFDLTKLARLEQELNQTKLALTVHVPT